MHRTSLALVAIALAACSGAAPKPDCDLSNATPQLHDSLSGSETWTHGVHEVTTSLTVGPAQRLTIGGCSEVRLRKDVSLRFSTGATLLVEGSELGPVRFVRASAADAWGSIIAEAPATVSLSYTSLEGGGGSAPRASSDVAGATLVAKGLAAAPPVVLTVNHVVVKDSTGLGLALVGARFDPASSDLTVTGAGWFPVYLGLAAATELPSGAYVGNAVDAILLQSLDVAAWDNLAPLTQNATVHDRGVPYQVGLTGADLVVGDGRSDGPDATLTLEAGVTVRFTRATHGLSQVLVQGAQRSGAWVPQGALVVQGTADRPVTFTSAEATPAKGDWLGLYFSKKVHAASTVNHAVVEYAGGDSLTTGVCKASVGAPNDDADCSILFMLEGDLGQSQLVLNTRVQHGLGCGVYRGWHGTDVDFRPSNVIVDVTGCAQSNVPPANGVCDATECSNP